jgi:hypothetical protein
VPEMDCVITTRSRALDPEPYARRAAALVNSGTPVIPAYSLLRCAETTLSSAVRTEGRTYGLPWSSRYAPTPSKFHQEGHSNSAYSAYLD